MKRKNSAISQEVLDQIIQRVVAVAQPDTIILFGSAARGEMGPHSDVDLLVVKSDFMIFKCMTAEPNSQHLS